MSQNHVSYAQILETNNLMQNCSDETYWLCVTRTVQESKLFPVPAYMMLSYLMAFYRYPSLLRKIETRLLAEEIGDRARNMGMKIQNPSMGWALPGFYLLGREWLINMGLLKPTDAIEDIIYVMNFWKRFQLSSHRNDGHITNKEFGHRAQLLPERRLQVFHADMFECIAGDALHSAAQAFMAAASQYGFLITCESRISMCNSGPYKIADDREMVVRDFMDLSESDFPWLDDIATDVPHNNLTVTMAVKDCHFHLMDDWGSFESKPEFKPEQLVGVGLYTSDHLSDGYVPLGMNSREELISTFKSLEEKVRDATTRLWRRIAAWKRDQMIDAGAIVYFAIIKDLAHVAGVYEVDDWMKVDERADRFRPLLNDEFSRDALGELVGLVSHPSQQVMEYTMAQHSNKPTRMYTNIPYSVLQGEPCTTTCGPLHSGITNLASKKDAYRTTRGVLTLAEYNRLSQEWVAPLLTDKYRFLCDTWVKYHAGTPLADELYHLEQDKSRNLKGKGSRLRRTEVDTLMIDRHVVLHGLAIKKHAAPQEVADITGIDIETVARLLTEAQGRRRVVAAAGKFMLTGPALVALRAEYSRVYADLRASIAMSQAYGQFEKINVELKQLITDWQTMDVGGKKVPNDHSSMDHDERLIDRLGALHERAEPALNRMAKELPRLNIYPRKLIAALEKAEDGAIEWVSDAKIASYHTVWFEMHEDLLRILGRERDE